MMVFPKLVAMLDRCAECGRLNTHSLKLSNYYHYIEYKLKIEMY